MKKSVYSTAEFIELNKQWQQKLAASGFNDIEKDEKSDTICTRQEFSPVKRSTHRAAVIAALLETDFALEKYRYGADKGKLKYFQLDILKLFASGKTAKQIVAELKQLHPEDKRAHLNVRGVQYTVSRFIKQATDRVKN